MIMPPVATHGAFDILVVRALAAKARRPRHDTNCRKQGRSLERATAAELNGAHPASGRRLALQRKGSMNGPTHFFPLLETETAVCLVRINFSAGNGSLE